MSIGEFILFLLQLGQNHLKMNPGLDFCLLFIDGKGGRRKGTTEASQQSKVFHGLQTLEIDYHLLSNSTEKSWAPEKLLDPRPISPKYAWQVHP